LYLCQYSIKHKGSYYLPARAAGAKPRFKHEFRTTTAQAVVAGNNLGYAQEVNMSPTASTFWNTNREEKNLARHH